MRFIVFSDYGHIRRHNALPGEIKSVDMMNVGIGLHVDVGTHYQLKFDYGFPLKTTRDTHRDDNGRGHLLVRLKF